MPGAQDRIREENRRLSAAVQEMERRLEEARQQRDRMEQRVAAAQALIDRMRNDQNARQN